MSTTNDPAAGTGGDTTPETPTKRALCKICDQRSEYIIGSGVCKRCELPAETQTVCPRCKGDGSTIEPAPFPIEEMEATTCPKCNGTGRAAETPTAGRNIRERVEGCTCLYHDGSNMFCDIHHPDNERARMKREAATPTAMQDGGVKRFWGNPRIDYINSKGGQE